MNQILIKLKNEIIYWWAYLYIVLVIVIMRISPNLQVYQGRRLAIEFLYPSVATLILIVLWVLRYLLFPKKKTYLSTGFAVSLMILLSIIGVLFFAFSAMGDPPVGIYITPPTLIPTSPTLLK
jgi:hypothetical protein